MILKRKKFERKSMNKEVNYCWEGFGLSNLKLKSEERSMYVTKIMVRVNRTTSMPNSVLRYVVNKEFNIYPSLISQMKVGDES